ncbi:MAG: MotA/TolQ/ExbB proton channel family protein [Planctomycetes bacterium]|nr:MotA/TolQ/ExbB proton channel family protein [Planctomycetota bacterium]
MDLATIVGLTLGTGLMLFGMLSVEAFATFVDYPSIYITVGGSLGATIISVSVSQIKVLPSVFMKCFLNKPEDPVELIQTLVHFGEVARRDGILALEGALEGVKDDFLIRGIQMAVDGNDPELILTTMTRELDNISARHGDGKKILDLLTKYAPAYGMLGTLIGLVALLKNLDDPESIGPNMAVALITTLYGALMANLTCGPMADKLSMRDAEEYGYKTIIIEGVMSIQSGDNPKIVEQKLRTFLPPKQRELLKKKEGA